MRLFGYWSPLFNSGGSDSSIEPAQADAPVTAAPASKRPRKANGGEAVVADEAIGAVGNEAPTDSVIFKFRFK